MKRIFEFRCAKDHLTEKLVDDEVRSIECPHCRNEASRIISSPRISLEGNLVCPDLFDLLLGYKAPLSQC